MEINLYALWNLMKLSGINITLKIKDPGKHVAIGIL